MAHAGTPTDLAQQPATSTTNGLWQALLAVIVILAIGAGVVMISSSFAAAKGSPAPAADHRLDQIETQRGMFSNAAPRADRRFDELIIGATPFQNESYSQVENNRGGAPTTGSSATKLGGTPVNSYDKVPGHRDALIGQ